MDKQDVCWFEEGVTVTIVDVVVVEKESGREKRPNQSILEEGDRRSDEEENGKDREERRTILMSKCLVTRDTGRKLGGCGGKREKKECVYVKCMSMVWCGRSRDVPSPHHERTLGNEDV